jgi:hypothetical protein
VTAKSVSNSTGVATLDGYVETHSHFYVKNLLVEKDVWIFKNWK